MKYGYKGHWDMPAFCDIMNQRNTKGVLRTGTWECEGFVLAESGMINEGKAEIKSA